jgi:amino-acid N-acetyltransferase
VLRIGLLHVTSDAGNASRDAATNYRTAMPGDLPSVEQLLTRNDLPTEGVADALANFIIAERGMEVVGAVGLELFGDLALLRSAVVAANLRGSGVGSRLIEAIIEIADRKHVRAVYLLTTTAEAFFPRFGFERIDRDDVPGDVKMSVEFRGACPASATVMRLALRAPHEGLLG